jgi:4-amino-4-deoxy-L-arabinose transferase-like glycosyltransferase
VAVLAVALAARIAYVVATPGYSPSHDDHAYDHLAVGIAHSGAYPDVNGRATAYRPPGYPYVLGAVYAVSGTGHARITTARLVQAVLGTGLVALIGLLGLRLFGPVAALVAMAIGAVYLPFIAVGAALLSEPQAAALELGAIVAVLAWRRTGHWRWAMATGVLGGALTLTRANAAVVLIAVAVGLWKGRQPGRSRRAAVAPAAVMLATAVAIVAPWTIRNAVVVHSFIPVSDEAGGTLAGTYNPISAADQRAPASFRLLAGIPPYQVETAHLATGPEPAFQSGLLRLALDYIGRHPLYPAKVAVFNTQRLLDFSGLSRARQMATTSGITSTWVTYAGVFSFWAVLAVAAAGVAMRRLHRAVPGFVWLAAGLLSLSIVLVSTETPRFRVPLDPLVILVAGAGLAAASERVRGRRAER